MFADAQQPLWEADIMDALVVTPMYDHTVALQYLKPWPIRPTYGAKPCPFCGHRVTAATREELRRLLEANCPSCGMER